MRSRMKFRNALILIHELYPEWYKKSSDSPPKISEKIISNKFCSLEYLKICRDYCSVIEWELGVSWWWSDHIILPFLNIYKLFIVV